MLKMLRDVGIVKQQKVGKQGRDDNIKQFGIELHIFNLKRYVGWGCILNCFMLLSLPCFPAFCCSAIPTFIFFRGACLSWSFLSITV